MRDTTYIYGLLCPLENKIRYVGKADDPAARYREHTVVIKWDKRNKALDAIIYGISPGAKNDWIVELGRQGQSPQLVILEEVNAENWRDREVAWLHYLKAEGHPLTNHERTLKQVEKLQQQLFEEALELGRQMFGEAP